MGDPGRAPGRRIRGVAGLGLLVTVLGTLGSGCGGGGPTTTEERGRAVAKDIGCVNCHGDEGQGGVGPTWAGAWGAPVELTDGTTGTFDDVYIERSVRDPASQKRAGVVGVMPLFELSDAQLGDLTSYIRSLG